MRHRILFASAFLYLAVSNLIWIARDTRPPFWDMAFHQTAALRIMNAFIEQGLAAIQDVPFLTGFYPPLYHSIAASFYAVFGVSSDAAQWANIPATGVLMGATYLIGRRLISPIGGAIAATLVAFYPIMLWLSREPMLDYWLAALVALSFWALLESDGLSNRRMAVLFGILAGLGMLTKWTFAVFLLFPAVEAGWRQWKNALLAGGTAAAVAAYWYLPRLSTLPAFLRLNTAGGVSEGDPTPWSWQALVFYVRALEGYQLFLPLFVVFLVGLGWLSRHFDRKWTPLLSWLLGGWLCLMIFQNKDPRYSAPLLPAVALVSAAWLARRPVWAGALLPLLVFQHYMVSFGVRALPQKVVIARGVDGPLSWDWNLYTQRYFDLWGPPMREDWQITRVLDRVSGTSGNGPVRVGLIPDIPRFDWLAFEYHILARRDPVVVRRLLALDPAAIHDNHYILLSEQAQGYPGLVPPEAHRISGYVLEHREAFEFLESFTLPNGETIRLYRVLAPA